MERPVEVRRLRGEAREAHAREALRRWDGSGLSAAAFARREGVHPVTLKRWREEFAEARGGPPAAGTFIELEVGARPGARALEVLLPDGPVVRVPAGFDEHELGRLLAALGHGRC
jgi:transposase-like protein